MSSADRTHSAFEDGGDGNGTDVLLEVDLADDKRGGRLLVTIGGVELEEPLDVDDLEDTLVALERAAKRLREKLNAGEGATSAGLAVAGWNTRKGRDL